MKRVAGKELRIGKVVSSGAHEGMDEDAEAELQKPGQTLRRDVASRDQVVSGKRKGEKKGGSVIDGIRHRREEAFRVLDRLE